MADNYSLDLRKRVVAFVAAGHSRHEAGREQVQQLLCSALAAGRIRVLDREAVKDGDGVETTRWAKLCSATHDGIKGPPGVP